MISFPKIAQFRNAVKAVRDRAGFKGLDSNGDPIIDKTAINPTLRYEGTVKLHGTNSGIALHADGRVTCQSRSRDITLESDNYGFARFVQDRLGHDWIRSHIEARFGPPDPVITVFGEWCGGGIQHGVALSQLDRMFVIFAILIGEDPETGFVLPSQLKGLEAPDRGLFTSQQFENFAMDIDFEAPDRVRNDLVSLTEGVEAYCPVGKALGVEGTGEGIVWRCVTEGFTAPRFWFKAKGEKHSASKVKVLNSVDPQVLASREAFLDAVLTERRLEQGIEHLEAQGLPVSKKSTGDFLRWLFNDIIAEEADTLEASGLTAKKIGGALSLRARRWFFAKLDERAMA